MGSKIIKIAMITLALGMAAVTGLKAQEVSEDEISVTVLKWFYNHYEKPEYVNWEIVKSETNEELFQASFTYKGQKIAAIYTKKGKRAYENVSFHKSSMPAPIVDYADTNYDKFKIVSIYRHTNFAYGARVDTDVNYEMVVKVKGEMSSVWFGQSMSRVSNFDTSNLALK